MYSFSLFLIATVRFKTANRKYQEKLS